MKQKILIYLLLAILTFVSVQWLILYVQGFDRTYQSLYRSAPVARVLDPENLRKREERKTLDCVPIQVIVDKASSKASGSARSGREQQGGLDSVPFQTLQQKRPMNSDPLFPEEAQPQVRHYPYLLNRFHLRAPILDHQSLSVYLQEDGSTTLTQTPDPSLFALGRLREFGLWVGYSYYTETNTDPQSLTDSTGQHLAYSFDLSYQQDLFKVGPAWSRLRVEAGYNANLGINGKAQIGIPIFRF